MQRVEEKSAPQSNLFQLLDEHVELLRIAKDGMVQFHLSDEKATQTIIADLKKNPQLVSLDIQKLRSNLTTYPDSKKPETYHVFSLSCQQIDALWGKDCYKICKEINNLIPKDCYKRYPKTDRLIPANPELINSLIKASESHPSFYPLLVRFHNDHLRLCIFENMDMIQSLETCLKLLDKLSKNALTVVLELKYTSCYKLERLIVHRLPPQITLKLIDYIADTMLTKMLRNQDSSYLWSGLSLVLSYQSPSICMKIIDRISDETLNHTIALTDTSDKSGLDNALAYQPPEVCIKLINRVKETVIDKLVGAQVTDDRIPYPIPLWRAAHDQTEGVFIALIQKSSPIVLANAAFLLHNNRSTFEIASQYQSSIAFKAFLQRLSDQATKLIINKYFKENPQRLFFCFELIALYQTVENCGQFLSLINTDVLKSLQKYCSETISTYPTRFALRAIHYKLQQNKDYANENLLKLLDILHTHDKTAPEEKKEQHDYSARDKRALNQFAAGAFVKIVREDKSANHDEFITHLFNPKNRHVIRDAKSKKWGCKALLAPQYAETKNEKKAEKSPKIYYTYPGGFPQIIYARDTQEREKHKKQKKPHTLSTKHPVTYISTKMHTSLFGYASDRELIGYAFTVNPKNIKFLATQDCGTHQRWWYSSTQFIVRHTNHALNFICQNFADFVKRVDQQPYVVNEALVKLGTEDLFAIVIGKGTAKARQVAIERRLQLRRLYKMDLPILFYHPEQRKAVPYTSYEQGCNHPALFLPDIQQSIQQQLNPGGLKGLFYSVPEVIQINVDDKTYRISTTTARKFLEIIRAKKPVYALSEIMIALESTMEIKSEFNSQP